MKPTLLAACVAFATLVPRLAVAANYAPLDCSKAASAAETTICRTYSLGQAEAHMATLYGIAMALVAMGQRGDIGDAQRAWLQTREACGGKAGCLSNVYDARIEQLQKVIDDIASRGPY
jgi:uncharacterized protein